MYTFSDVFEYANNIAYTSGSLLFGGLLDRCTVSSLTIRIIRNTPRYLVLLRDILNDTSSHPIKLCSCAVQMEQCMRFDINNEIEENLKTVKKGETFSLYVVAIDQMNHTINATIHSYLSNTWNDHRRKDRGYKK